MGYHRGVRSPASEQAAQAWAGSLLRLARARTGMTQRQLAAASGVAQPTLSRIERGAMQPTFPLLAKILSGAGLEVRARLEPYDDHDDVLWAREQLLTPAERTARGATLDDFARAAR